MHFRIVLLCSFYANYYIYALCIITLIFTWSWNKIAVPSTTKLYSYLTNQNMFSSLFDSHLIFSLNIKNLWMRIWILDIIRMRIWIWEYESSISFEWEYESLTYTIVWSSNLSSTIEYYMHTFYQVVTYTYYLITYYK